MTLLIAHLAAHVKPADDALVFTGDLGGPISRNNFNKRVKWSEHAAESGASLRDLMTRMGHDSMRAALIYQHRTQEGDRRIAEAMADMIDEHDNDAAQAEDEPADDENEPEDDDPDDGAAGALVRVGYSHADRTDGHNGSGKQRALVGDHAPGQGPCHGAGDGSRRSLRDLLPIPDCSPGQMMTAPRSIGGRHHLSG